MDMLTLERATQLYVKYQEPLRQARAEQGDLLNRQHGMRAQLDDIEAELTYLVLRDVEPDNVVEVGSLHGWSTTWQLRALRDNGRGRLHTFDLVDDARRRVPAELGAHRWRFVGGDVRQHLDLLPDTIDCLFVDAAHTARFARWYLAELVPRVSAGVPISVHDVFHHRRPWPFSEGAAVLDWLDRTGTTYFTAAPARDRRSYQQLITVRAELGLTGTVHSGRHNPMIYFHRP